MAALQHTIMDSGKSLKYKTRSIRHDMPADGRICGRRLCAIVAVVVTITLYIVGS